jgi:hypothetical protein
MKAPPFFLGLVLVSASGLAAEQSQPAAPEGDLPAAVPQEQPAAPVQKPHRATAREILLDEPHDFLSRRVEEYSRRLDNFFGDPNRSYDSTGSTLQIRSHTTFFEGGLRQGRTELRANVSLPNTEDRLKLVVQRGLEAATETAAERDIRNSTGSNQVAAPGAAQDNDYYTGLKAEAAKLLGVTLSAEAGLKFGRPIDPYVRLRVFRDFTLSQWVVRFSETPLWKRSEGSSAASEVDSHLTLNEAWHVRITSKATWRETTTYFDLAQIESLFWTPDKLTAYTLELGAFAPSESSLKQSVYALTLRARRQIYRDWLYFEVTPQILYQQANGYRADRSLTLQLEMLFGDRYLPR